MRQCGRAAIYAIDKLTDEDWAWVLSVNVTGMVDTVACFLPLLRKASGERHIVLTASASYFTPGVRMAAYVTSKYAVVGYGEVLRQELAEEDINVALLFPAGMATRHLQQRRRASGGTRRIQAAARGHRRDDGKRRYDAGESRCHRRACRAQPAQ
ncbi:MAG: SDR family oxidoreductase [Haliea sp.]|nr:SDR family oxidoreductase [Haliea sp.]